MVRCLYVIMLLSFTCVLEVKSSSDADNKDDSSTEYDNDDYVQPPPITMSKVMISKSTIRLEWDWPSTLPSHFVVYYNNNSVDVDKSEVLLKNLLPYTNYSVKVVACTPSCSHIFGPEVYRTKPGIPGQVENFGMRQINITHFLLLWDAPRVPAGPEQFYKVRVVNSTSVIEMNTTATNVTLPRPSCDDGFITTQTVTVRGVSIDPGAKVFYGNTSTTLILYVDCLWEANKKLIREFLIERLIVSRTSIKLWWLAAKNAAYYRITFNNQSTIVNSTYFELNNLTPNTNYKIQVTGCDANGTCFVSTEPIRVPTKPGEPDKVENLKVTKVNTTAILISWQPPSIKHGRDLFYRVLIQSPVMGKRTFDTDLSETLIQIPECKGEEFSANYTTTVTTVNPNGGIELTSESINATIFLSCARFEILPPQLPHIDRIDIGSTWIKLGWSLLSISADSYYLVEFNSNRIQVMDSLVVLQDLTPSTSYAVQLYLCTKNCSSFFGPANIQTKALIPISVQNLLIIDVNSTHFSFNWQPPLALAEANVSYKVALNELEFITNTTHFILTKPICESENLLINVSVGLDHFNHSIYESEPVIVTAPYPCLKLQSTFTQILTQNSSILLEWTPVDTGNLESVYKVSYNNTEIQINETTILLENLEPSTVYDIQVVICMANRCHLLIKPLTVHTQPSPPIPEKPVVMKLLNSSHALLSWTLKPSNESCSYSILIKFSNSSVFINTTDLPSQCGDIYEPSSSYVIEVTGNERLCDQSDNVLHPPLISVLEQAFSVKEILNNWNLPVYVNKVVASPTTIELEWNGTDLGDYYVLYNQSASNVHLPKIQLTDLKPNSSYSIEIFKCNNGSCNTSAVAPFIIHTPPQIICVQNATFIVAGPQVLNITWQPPDSWPTSKGLSWQYRVLVSIGTVKLDELLLVKPFTIVKLPAFDGQLEVVIRITPYSSENLNLISQETVVSIRLQAGPKAFINQIEVSSEKIVVTWSDFSVNSDFVYLIKCNETISTWSNDSSMSATLSGLIPDTVYKVQLLKCSQDACGQLIGSSFVRTQQSVRPPLKVEHLQVQPINSTYVYLNWSTPEYSETNFSHFVYDIRLVQTKQTNNTNIHLLNRCQSVLWPDTYEIAVKAAGQWSTWNTIEVQCQPDLMSNDTNYKSQPITAMSILIFVAVAGFVVGAAVYACTCRTFNYTYKVKGGQS